MTIEEFRKLLDAHDWYYDFSDDGNVMRRGRAAEDRLKAIAASSPELQEYYTAYCRRKYNPSGGH